MEQNLWAVLADELQTCMQLHAARDQEKKFYKICNSRKKTRELSCPSVFLHAKHFARDIQGKSVAQTLSDENGSTGEIGDRSDTEGATNVIERKNIVRARGNKRSMVAGVLVSKKAKREESLIDKWKQ